MKEQKDYAPMYFRNDKVFLSLLVTEKPLDQEKLLESRYPLTRFSFILNIFGISLYFNFAYFFINSNDPVSTPSELGFIHPNKNEQFPPMF